MRSWQPARLAKNLNVEVILMSEFVVSEIRIYSTKLFEVILISEFTNSENIGLNIPGNWSFEIRRISHKSWWISCEIHMKSGGFHLKSAQNLPDFMKSVGFHECGLLGDHQV